MPALSSFQRPIKSGKDILFNTKAVQITVGKTIHCAKIARLRRLCKPVRRHGMIFCASPSAEQAKSERRLRGRIGRLRRLRIPLHRLLTVLGHATPIKISLGKRYLRFHVALFRQRLDAIEIIDIIFVFLL